MNRIAPFNILILSLLPVAALALEPPLTVNGEALDLRLLREDIPPQVSGSSSRGAEHSAPRRATQATSGAGRRQDQPPRGGFRSDLPYGAGFEARQGRASTTTLRGLGQGGGRGAGGGRGR